jgi:hypothetical protein
MCGCIRLKRLQMGGETVKRQLTLEVGLALR